MIYLVYFRPKGLTFSKLVCYSSDIADIGKYKKDPDYEIQMLGQRTKEMKMKITPLEEGKTRKGGFFYSALLREADGSQQVMKGFYSPSALPLNKEVEVNVRFGRDNVYFIR